jgi:ubiquinone/menaquinone biosynthesis C-methylase UbiE
MSQLEHFGRLASRYDELRPPPAAQYPLVDVIAHEGRLAGRHVLDIGCGTANGMIALRDQHGCRVTGVDPSPAMLDQACAKLPDSDLRLGTAEDLPFDDESFDGATMISVVHHTDRARAMPEARRVLSPGSRFVSADMHPDGFQRWWAARFFPSLVELERERFPAPEALVEELRWAGFTSAWWRLLPVERRFSREEGLARLRGRAYSTLDLLEESEYRTGIARAERELPERIEYTLEWAIVVGER